MKKILFALLCFTAVQLKAQSNFFDINTVQKIEIFFSQPNWDYQMDTAKYGGEGYVIADSVLVNGVVFDSVGVKYKGNSSYDSTYVKNPLHVELDNVISQSYQGVRAIKLSNEYDDPSLIREVMGYAILRNYMHAPQANFAKVYINGVYIGVYTNDESIDKDFCSTHFLSSSNTFIKCNPASTPGPTVKSNLKYIPLADSTAYFNLYEVKSNYGWSDLVSLCDTVTNFPNRVPNNMNMDRALWMLAFNSAIVNLDSYTGVFAQNFYLYKDNTGLFNPIVWDLNMSFGGFPFIGAGNSSMGSMSIANMQQLLPTMHATDPYWPLINMVMSDPMYKRMYMAHLRTIINEFFTNNNYLTTATQLQTLIDTCAQADTNMFFTYSAFQSGLNTNQNVGSYSVPGISNLMNARVTYLSTNTDYNYVSPTINNVLPSNTSPNLNDVISITAQVANANSSQVYLGYRYNLSDNFIRILMYDDGAHNDGAAGDFIFGTSLNISAAQTQYYIYAENNDAGIFSPQRAENEFYNIQAQIPLPSAGQITINEFVASNTSGATNENGTYGDWIELYNNTSTPLSLYGLYLSDNFLIPAKYAFPMGTIIQPDDVLLVWVDELVTTSGILHANFKLSASGERIIISDGAALVIDSLTFGPQVDNVSYGRCPDGTGSFTTFVNPTFDSLNCFQNVVKENKLKANNFSLYPNPASGNVRITGNTNSKYVSINVMNVYGQQLSSYQTSIPYNLPIEQLASGIYIISMTDGNWQWQQKLVINKSNN